MKVIKREQARDYSNGANCSGHEFNLDTQELDGAVVRVSGRFPERGQAVNEKCKEVAYIIEGSGKITINQVTFQINKEDLVVIDKGEYFFWDGDFKLFVYCTPAWSPEQHKHIV